MSFWNLFHREESDNKHDEIVDLISSLNTRLDKIENRQKETSLQLEDLDSLLQEESREGLPEALMALIEIIYDFYQFADSDSPLYEQARMMFNKAVKSAKVVNLEVIADEGTVFDFRLHTAQGTESVPDLPDGCIIRTLQCGFMYRDKILRRAVVIINKKLESR